MRGVLLFTAIVGLFLVLAYAAHRKDVNRAERRVVDGEAVCEDHRGLLLSHEVTVGFGAHQYVAVCRDGTEVRIP